MKDLLLSWGAVYVVLFLPAILMLCNFVFGNCFLGAELARSQQTTGSLHSRARILGRSCIALVLVSFAWQYGAFMFTSRPHHARECNWAFFVWDMVDMMPYVWRVDRANVLICDGPEVAYQITFAAFLVLFLTCVFSSPQVAVLSNSASDRNDRENGSDGCSHCRKCAAFVLDMDHHCYLIGNCVGRRNRHLFVMCLLCGVVNLSLLLWSRWRWVLQDGGPVTAFGLVLVVCFDAVLLTLFVWQVLLLSCGYTTLRLLKVARERRCSALAVLWYTLIKHESTTMASPKSVRD